MKSEVENSVSQEDTARLKTTPNSDKVSKRGQAVQITNDKVLPAFQEFVSEREAQNRHCHIMHSHTTVSVEVRFQQRREFLYGIKIESRKRPIWERAILALARIFPVEFLHKTAQRILSDSKEYHPIDRFSVSQAAKWQQGDFNRLLVKKYQEAMRQHQNRVLKNGSRRSNARS